MPKEFQQLTFRCTGENLLQGARGCFLLIAFEVGDVLTGIVARPVDTTLTQLILTIRCACYDKNSKYRDIFKRKHSALSNDLHDSSD